MSKQTGRGIQDKGVWCDQNKRCTLNKQVAKYRGRKIRGKPDHEVSNLTFSRTWLGRWFYAYLTDEETDLGSLDNLHVATQWGQTPNPVCNLTATAEGLLDL